MPPVSQLSPPSPPRVPCLLLFACIVTPHSLDYIKCGKLEKFPKKFTVGIFGSILDADKGSDIVHSFLKLILLESQLSKV